MSDNMKNAVIYVPIAEDANDLRWDIIAASLRAAGVQDIRPAPMPAQNYVPRQLRTPLISSLEV